jgi:hypothetical protein
MNIFVTVGQTKQQRSTNAVNRRLAASLQVSGAPACVKRQSLKSCSQACTFVLHTLIKPMSTLQSPGPSPLPYHETCCIHKIIRQDSVLLLLCLLCYASTTCSSVAVTHSILVLLLRMLRCYRGGVILLLMALLLSSGLRCCHAHASVGGCFEPWGSHAVVILL